MAPKTGRPKLTGAPKRTIAVRLPADLMTEIEAERARITADKPGLEVTLADAIRVLLMETIATRKARTGKK